MSLFPGWSRAAACAYAVAGECSPPSALGLTGPTSGLTVNHFLRAAWLCLLVAPLLHAQSAPNQVHTPPQSDPGVYSGRLKVDYPTRYEPATHRRGARGAGACARLCRAGGAARVVNAVTGEPVAYPGKLPAEVALARTDLQILSYEWGVTYAGMLLASEITGDPRYRSYTDTRLSALATLAAHMRRRLPADATAAMYPRAAARPRAAFHAVATRARRCRRHVRGLHQGRARGAR